MRAYFTVLCCIALTHLACDEVSSQEQSVQNAIVNGGFEFAGKLNQLLYKQAQQTGNVLFSPINIYSALALVHLGADGNTRDEIAKVLGLPKGSDKIQQTHEALSQILRTIENTTAVEQWGPNGWAKVKPNVINIANGIFVQNGIDLVQSYVSQVQAYYKGKVSNVDFAKESSEATNTVNQFISNNTNGRIPKLFESPISSDTTALIAACLYFKAAWEDEFYDGATKEENFNTGSGNSLTKMMTQRLSSHYINIPELGLEAMSLPYAAGDASMFFVLPYPNQTLDNVISSLNGPVLQRIVKESTWAFMDVKIPRMKYKWTNKVNDQLLALGINELFSKSAKLNNIASNIALKVSEVTHAAEIEVNEKGTEASAVTVVKMAVMSAISRPEPIPFHVNRPFAFFIYHQKTQAILFLGAVHNPNGISNSLPF